MSENRLVESQLADLKSRGMPTTKFELNDYYDIPAGEKDATGNWIAAIDAVTAANLGERAQSLPFFGNVPGPIPPPGLPWAQLDASRALLDELYGELQAVRVAAKSKGMVRYPGNLATLSLTPSYRSKSRQVSRLLALDAHVSAHAGNYERVLDDLKAIFALSESLKHEPTLSAFLSRHREYSIGFAQLLFLMPHCNWSDKELESLQNAISSPNFKNEMTIVVRGERAISLSLIDEWEPDGFDTVKTLRAINKRDVLQFTKLSIDAFSNPWPDAMNTQLELTEESKKLADRRIAPKLLAKGLHALPFFELIASAGGRATARQRCANAAIAAQRHRLQHGELPKALTEIDDNLFATASADDRRLIDPFDGNPLRYKDQDDGVLIYSISEDKIDDGGNYDFTKFPLPTDLGFWLPK